MKFLIVHHSGSHNGHTGADAPDILREFYDFHTVGRGWNDVAYNFLIDADGGIWEGREGSVDGPVAGDATGGNQGYAQLVCLIGDYNVVEPTQASLSSLVSLLAWIADRDEVLTAPGATATFTSRGSNKHPEGATVTTPTITGHRTMSVTSCPGDHLNPYVTGALMIDVTAARAESALATTSTTTTTTSSVTTTSPTTTVASPSTTLPTAVESSRSGLAVPAGMFGTAGLVVVAGASLLLWRHRRMRKGDRGE